MEPEEVARRVCAMERRQDEWMHQANQKLADLCEQVDRLLRKLDRVIREASILD